MDANKNIAPSFIPGDASGISTLDIKVKEGQIVKPTPRERFHVGIHANKGNPAAWHLAIGGVMFSVSTEDREGTKQIGNVYELDAVQIGKIQRQLPRMIVRTFFEGDGNREPKLDKKGQKIIRERQILDDNRADFTPEFVKQYQDNKLPLPPRYEPMSTPLIEDTPLAPHIYIKPAPKSIKMAGVAEGPDFSELHALFAQARGDEKKEQEALGDPNDAKVRQAHAQAKAAGQPAPTEAAPRQPRRGD